MFAADIEKKIDNLFGNEAGKARGILETALTPDDSTQRVIRCIITLGKDSLVKLQEAANVAKEDFRDVIAGAEYDKTGNRIADFNKPFKS